MDGQRLLHCALSRTLCAKHGRNALQNAQCMKSHHCTLLCRITWSLYCWKVGAVQCHMLLTQNIDVDTGRSLNVAYLYGAYEDSKNVMLVMELCKGGEMWNRVRSGRYSEKGASCHVPAQSFARPLFVKACACCYCAAHSSCVSIACKHGFWSEHKKQIDSARLIVPCTACTAM